NLPATEHVADEVMPLTKEGKFVNVVGSKDMRSIQCCSAAIQTNVVGIFGSVTTIADVISEVLGPGIRYGDLRCASEAPLGHHLQTVVVRVELWRDHCDRTIASERSDLIQNVRRNAARAAAEISSGDLAWYRGNTG